MNIRLVMRVAAAFALVLQLSLTAGCNSSPFVMPDGVFGNQSSQKPKADSRLQESTEASFFSRSGFEACVGGAFAGALLCQVSNASDKKDCMLKAAFVGCGVAMGANYYYDYRRAQYASQEQMLDAMIADVKEDNRKLQSLNNTAKAVLEENKKQLAKIKSDIANNKVETAEASRTLQEVDANADYLKSTLADLKKREKEWREVAAKETGGGAQLDALNSEINRMQQQIAVLESDIDALYDQRSAIQLG